ncbi:hypothetical protein F441_18073 [Phytophthora nicotianae CJ01A1]|uniref:Uncharacterized protein n=1 Tax=Phytophthora nicotianae CJ01A1 TaxID=1317063 RepID=W2W423_PHYNI|nr:hypothetical protein F441_18073 [Phytophthora nicotianae CJ01A1]
MERRRGGGSASTKQHRKRRKGPDRKEAAYVRAVELLGEDNIKKMGEDWESWDTSEGGREWQQSEGVVLQLLRQGLSERVIRVIPPVGGNRVARLKKMLESGVETFHTRREPSKPAHAFSDECITRFKEHCSPWVMEDGFPCAHRIPRQYFTEPNIT